MYSSIPFHLFMFSGTSLCSNNRPTLLPNILPRLVAHPPQNSILSPADYQAELSPNDNVDVDTNFDMVYGIAPVLNALRNNRREKLGLYCQDGLAPANKKDRAAANQIYDLSRETDVP